MFALSLEDKNLSPLAMRFMSYWLYDLRPCSSFWRNKVSQNEEFLTAGSPWDLLCKVYNIHLFSSLTEVRVFAKDYFYFFQKDHPSKRFEKVFLQLHRLGMTKLGHLKRIPKDQMIRRWGKDWTELFIGLMEPTRSTWPWISYRKPLLLEKKKVFDFGVQEVDLLIEEVLSILKGWHQKKSNLHLKALHIQLITQEVGEDVSLEFHFHSSPLLGGQMDWLQRLLQFRFAQLQLSCPLSALNITLEPAAPAQNLQLSLFSSSSKSRPLNEVIERLHSFGAQLFQPQILASSLPESSWTTIPPKENFKIEAFIQNRPLIQHPPQSIPAPDYPLQLVEQVDCFSTNGIRLHRDYFVAFRKGRWRWLFEDQNKNWFQQGLAE